MNALEVTDLSFAWPGGGRALNEVSFRVREGECLGLIGPNGAGKSTLLLHLNGLLPDRLPSDSPVRVFGEPVARDHLDRIRRRVGLLFQNPDDQLFCSTVFEDVAFGPRQFGWSEEAVETAVSRSLAQAGVPDFGGRPPHHLSQGEKRRVCLAGLLACGPELLLLDEPSSDLDPRGRREWMGLLADLPVTRLIASHDLSLVADLCARVLVLDGGRVQRIGPAKEVLADQAFLAEHGLA